MNRLIITGAGGFLGSNVIDGVITENFFDEVIAITLGAEQYKECVGEVEKLHIYEADAIKTGEVGLREEDLVLNCAYPRAMKGADVTSGLDYGESIFRAAAEANIKGIVNISSQSVYDPRRDHPAVESDVPVLTDEYAIGKYCMELLLRNVCKNIPYTNIRLASLIGPGFDVRVPNKMVKYALEKGEIKVQVNDQHFGYLDVSDAVRGLVGVLKMEPMAWKPVYNLGSEKTVSLLEMAESIAKKIKDISLRNVAIIKSEGSGILNSALDNTLLKKDIGEYQTMSFQDSIEKIINACSI